MKTFALWCSLATFLAACSGPPPVCDSLAQCCANLPSALVSSCESSAAQAAELDADQAEQACENALTALRTAGQCGEAGEANDGGTSAADGGGGAPDLSVMPGLPPSRGLSESCDPNYGLDACGAALFCAAFDGRTVPTCYPEGIRRSGETCTEDRQCSSRGCNEGLGLCAASEGETCETALGCASLDHFCSLTRNTCRPAVNGQEGAACGDDAHCNRGLGCQQESCAPTGEVESPCFDEFDCVGDLLCRSGRCDWARTEGSSCERSEHCASSLACEGGSCTRPANGACQVAENNCRPGQYCQLTSLTPEAAMCVDEGPAIRGQSCHQGQACSGGSTCMAFADIGGRCFAPCDPNAEACGPGWDCIPLPDLSFGLCLALRCSPFTCGAGEICDSTFDLATEELLGCAPAGPVPLGGSCANARCAAPGFCVELGTGPACAAPCDQDHDCSSGSCLWLSNANFGVCG